LRKASGFSVAVIPLVIFLGKTFTFESRLFLALFQKFKKRCLKYQSIFQQQSDPQEILKFTVSTQNHKDLRDDGVD
jgi:hypothetical protein